MKDIEKLYQELDNYAKLIEREDAEKFLQTTDKIISLKRVSSIPILLKYFDDNFKYTWILESLMIAMEDFPYDLHTIKLIENLNFLLMKAPLWTVEIFNRIINDQKSKEIFIQNINLSDNQSLKKLFELIEIKCPHHRKFIQDMRNNTPNFPM